LAAGDWKEITAKEITTEGTENEKKGQKIGWEA
jgi:hypothetical protein